MGLREEATVILSSLGAIASGALTWFLASPLLGVVTGVFVTLLAQTWSQRRTVKREFAIDNSTAIYSPLYQELNAIGTASKSFNYDSGYQTLNTGEWQRVRSTHYYQFIPPKLRSNLDRLYESVDTYNFLIPVVNQRVQDLILERATSFYGTQIVGMIIGGKAEGLVYGGKLLPNPLIFGITPQTILSDSYPDRKDMRIVIYCDQRAQNGQIGTVTREGEAEVEKFQGLYGNMMKDVAGLDVVRRQRNLLDGIVRSSPEIQNEVFRKIKESWSV